MAIVPKQHVADDEVYAYWCKNLWWSPEEFAALYCGLNPATWKKVNRLEPKFTLDEKTREKVEDVCALVERRLKPQEWIPNPPHIWRALLPRLGLVEPHWITMIPEPETRSITEESVVPGLEKPLRKRERDTLLTIIAALCDYSGLNYGDRGASVRIAQMTQDIGAQVSDDAIRGWLQKIPDALETRTK